MTRRLSYHGLLLLLCIGSACTSTTDTYDAVIRGGTVYDGSGTPGYVADVALNADTIAVIGTLDQARGHTEIDATGLAVAPGFINMLSWATTSLIADGRSLGDIKQGVTLEVFGEGWSLGPLNEAMKTEMKVGQGDIQYEIDWTTLGEYLESLEARGVSPNVASFVGATTVRIHVLGYENRAPTPQELARMQALVRAAMEEGALGVGSSLIYAPAFYADTDELIALCQVAADYGGMYISHMRSEGNQLLEAVDELISIARTAGIRAEIYHLKAAGQSNWDKLDAVIERIEAARTEGLDITTDMYTYTAGSTGLDAAMPPEVQEGGFGMWRTRLMDEQIRAEVIKAMDTPSDDWENLYYAAGAENVLLVGLRNPALRSLIGKTLAEVALMRGKTPAETAVDLVIEDSSRVESVYFLMTEDNVRRQMQLPWMSFGSDAASMAPEGQFLNTSTHPRAYGNFARLLGPYVRDQGVMPLEEAIRRLTALPAENLRLDRRGRLQPGYYADLALFDPATIRDHATYEAPHQLATGMVHVFVNGVHVLADGEHTGATPGRVVRGPGYQKKEDL